mgnify:CR=1 FL=1
MTTNTRSSPPTYGWPPHQAIAQWNRSGAYTNALLSPNKPQDWRCVKRGGGIQNAHLLTRCWSTPSINVALEMAGNNYFVANKIKNPDCTLLLRL